MVDATRTRYLLQKEKDFLNPAGDTLSQFYVLSNGKVP